MRGAVCSHEDADDLLTNVRSEFKKYPNNKGPQHTDHLNHLHTLHITSIGHKSGYYD